MAQVQGLYVSDATVQEIKEFLDGHKQEIINNKWQKVFDDFTYGETDHVICLASFLTIFLLAANVDFLPYLETIVPNCFYNICMFRNLCWF